MVDALHEAARALKPGALLVDARPDSRVLAKIEQGGRIVAGVPTQRAELSDDRAADRAVAAAKRERLFRRVRAGRFWHRVPFDDLATIQTYLRDHLRFAHRPSWRMPPAERRKRRDEPFTLIRAVRFEVLERS